MLHGMILALILHGHTHHHHGHHHHQVVSNSTYWQCISQYPNQLPAWAIQAGLSQGDWDAFCSMSATTPGASHTPVPPYRLVPDPVSPYKNY